MTTNDNVTSLSPEAGAALREEAESASADRYVANRLREELDRALGTIDSVRITLRAFDIYKSDDVTGMAREVVQTVHDLNQRITELQATGTKLENERRMWKSRANASKRLLMALLHGALERFGGEDCVMTTVRLIESVQQRNENLERDTWSAAGGLVRTFLAEAKDEFDGETTNLTPHVEFIRRWVKRFQMYAV